MAINDILPQVDPVPGLDTGRRSDKPTFVTDTATTDSSYQRALSRSLNERGREEPPSSDGTPKPENTSPSTADERPAPKPTGIPTESRSTDETNESTPQEPTPQPTTTSGSDRADFDQSETETPDSPNESNDSVPDVVKAAAVVISIQSPPAEISTGDYQEPKPPANLSSLFATTTTGEQDNVEVTTLDVETSGDESLRPPSGLFETPAANKAEQQSKAEASPNENSQVSPSAVIDNETLNAELLPTEQAQTEQAQTEQALTEQSRAEQSQAENFATPHDAESVNTSIKSANTSTESASTSTTSASNSTETSAQYSATGQSTEVDIARTNASAAADETAAARSTHSEESPDRAAPSSTPTNPLGPGNLNLSTGEKPHSGRLTQNDETGGHRDDGEHSGPAAGGSLDSTEESSSTPQATTARQSESVGDSVAARRTDGESRSESIRESDSDTSRSTVTAVRTDTGRTTIPVPSSPSTPSLADTPPVDAEQLVERVAAGIRAAPPNGQQLRVKLYPPHLGQLQIEVNSHGGTVSVRMEVQNVAAQNTLHENLPLLREALVHHGTPIDRIDVQLVETNAEDGRSDLTDEQQQQARQEADDQQPKREDQEQVTAEDSETRRQPVAAAHNMDELDIQV